MIDDDEAADNGCCYCDGPRDSIRFDACATCRVTRLCEDLPEDKGSSPGTVAALFVEAGGCYFGLDDVDPWDEQRDARLYAGPWPVVAHPPCQRWGRYWSGGPSAKVRRTKGDDAGCFASALASVRAWGGVLEHPESSHAWRAHGLIAPLRGGGWSVAGDGIGWTCCVEQGHYGHRARKATWLYAVGCELPLLRRGRSSGIRLDEGFHSTRERHEARDAGIGPGPRLTAYERLATPVAFRDVLIGMARSVRAERQQVSA